MKYNEVIVTTKTFYSYQTFSVLYGMFWSTWLKHVLKYTQYLTTIQGFCCEWWVTSLYFMYYHNGMFGLKVNKQTLWIRGHEQTAVITFCSMNATRNVLHPWYAPSDCWTVPVIPWIRNILCFMEEGLYHVQGEYWSRNSPKNGKPRKHNTTVIHKLYFHMHNFNQFNTQFLT